MIMMIMWLGVMGILIGLVVELIQDHNDKNG
jgi:hypothetical protein